MSAKQEKSGSRPRGGRLARRARSFKEDFLGRISQMRSPSGTRSGSPNKTPYAKRKTKGETQSNELTKSHSGKAMDIDSILPSVKELTHALRYFQDVVEKNTLEMLPGSATIVLETVLNIHSLLGKCFNDQSSLLMSATNQVYQNLANLIRWSDSILLYGDKAANKESVADVVHSVHDAVKTLVQLCVDRLQNTDSKSSQSGNSALQNGLRTPNSENSHRNSLPDIPLTPREQEILKQTSFSALVENAHPPGHLHHSLSSDSILSSSSRTISDDAPPPKPPLPLPRENPPSLPASSASQTPPQESKSPVDSAPPLPPKKRSSMLNTSHNDSLGLLSSLNSSMSGRFSPNSSFSSTPLLSLMDGKQSDFFSPEWPGILSRSPENSTPLSKSSASSLDSNLNHSTDDLLSSISKSQSFQHQTKYEAHCDFEANCSSKAETTLSYEYVSYSSSVTAVKTFSTTSTTESTAVAAGTIGEQIVQKMKQMSASALEETSSSSTTTTTASTSSSSSTWNKAESNSAEGTPPALPVKQRPIRYRTLSQYDNVPQFFVHEVEGDEGKEASGESASGVHNPTCPRAHSPQPLLQHQGWYSGSHANSCPHHFLTTSVSQDTSSSDDPGKPPPLPPKKKNIMAYMQMFGSYSQPAESEFYRHSVHTYQVIQAQWQQVELSFIQQRSFKSSVISSSEDSVFSDGPSSQSSLDHSYGEDEEQQSHPVPSPPILPPKKGKTLISDSVNKLPPTSISSVTTLTPEVNEKISTSSPSSIGPSESSSSWEPTRSDATGPEDDLTTLGPLDELDVYPYLVFGDKDGHEIRGGSVDALIVKATDVNKNDFEYQAAFVTTYRTFVTPLELIQKLLYRYNKFIHMSDMRQRLARNAFALLVAVVDDMCIGDLDEAVLRLLMDFIYQLVSRGDLVLAKALRTKVVEKCQARQRALTSVPILLPSMAVTTRQASLLDFKSEHLAEQMTLLDADLFQKIEIPEVLLFAKEQKEELSPNLTMFTEHFNKMSYWARSRILEQEEARERERYVMKFIKIMKHLRKLNNFNSYLAILSALDSAPIRRLEWQRNITEGLKEYCALIDSSSSFRAYRLALAETEPPCIPYIGLILQDLTFVHIGNSDYLPDNSINFTKRWQQYNILQNMRKFKHCQYLFKRNDQIVAFFNNFDDYLCEEAMWQISESIKPRGGKKKTDLG